MKLCYGVWPPLIGASIRPTIFCAGSRSRVRVQSAADPSMTFIGPGMIDEALGRRGGQQQFARGDGDEGVAPAVDDRVGCLGVLLGVPSGRRSAC